jgi:hypothetical protein
MRKDPAPVANGKVATTPSGMRIDFDKGSACGTLLLSPQMTFELQYSFDRSTPVLVFSGAPPDGVSPLPRGRCPW